LGELQVAPGTGKIMMKRSLGLFLFHSDMTLDALKLAPGTTIMMNSLFGLFHFHSDMGLNISPTTLQALQVVPGTAIMKAHHSSDHVGSASSGPGSYDNHVA
jgi:hypothetical protein